MMKDEGFDINKTGCGPYGRTPLSFALGVDDDDPIDEDAVKLVLAVPGLEFKVTETGGFTHLLMQCGYGRSRNIEFLLADARDDPNQQDAMNA
jgi:hypothetical protein